MHIWYNHGNKYLKELFNYSDEYTSINQLLKFLKYKGIKFLEDLWNKPIDLDL